MARTNAAKATEVKAKAIKAAVKEIPKAATVVTATIYALPTTSEVKVSSLHIWEKIAGKYHTKDRKVIGVGQTFVAGKDTFAKDPTWKYVGPAE